jgi:16S rRNA (uracil1498-N3)-methyltransferase
VHHRIYVPDLQASGEAVVEGDEFHHAVRVARVREGEEVELFDGRGAAAAGRVLAIGHDRVSVRIERPIEPREPKVDMTVAMSIIQLEKFELVLQKVTELGARSIIPLITDRIELRPERYRGKRERWEKIVFEAVKQSGRARLPDIHEPARFDDAVASEGLRVVFDAEAEPSPLPAHIERVMLLIGAEGGFSEREIELARDRGCRFQRLGSRRLRAETAAIVAAATIARHSGELD